MESKIREITNHVINRNPLLSGRKIGNVCVIRKRRGKFIWKISLSPDNVFPRYILVKAVEPKKKNMAEIMLYKMNPEYLRSFFPAVYGIIKKYGFYWMFLEWLEKFPAADISLENFKKPIEFMASLHSGFYSNNSAIGDKRINWVPRFESKWRRKTNKLRLILQYRKYKQCPRTKQVLAKDDVLFENIIRNLQEILHPLAACPRSLIHGCFDYSHIYIDRNNGLRLIDWENFSFAPVTLDAIYLIEKSIENIKSSAANTSKFREECLNYYFDVMKTYGLEIDRLKFKKLYNITLLFKIITQFIFEELKKIKQGKPSNYSFYRDQLFTLREYLNLAG
ncbi:MAG: hypothetical protein PHW62_03580 [Candidatus Ratteibacteria bacterium]|nr:hypothetical protein [Candidatus Ratteibacteria bacterium]